MQPKSLAIILQRMLALYMIINGTINILTPFLIMFIQIRSNFSGNLRMLLIFLPQLAAGIALWLLAGKIAGWIINCLDASIRGIENAFNKSFAKYYFRETLQGAGYYTLFVSFPLPQGALATGV